MVNITGELSSPMILEVVVTVVIVIVEEVILT